jgi:hypothetical protein
MWFPWLDIQKIDYSIKSEILIGHPLFLLPGDDKSVCNVGKKWLIAAKTCGALARMVSL